MSEMLDSINVVVVASNNKHKVDEISAILKDVMPAAEFKPMEELTSLPKPAETGTTFEENAFIKADAIHKETGLPTVADDSGLMVDALNGEPGVYSSRYAGVDGDDAANNKKLLEAMENVDEYHRSARFVSCVAFVTDDFRTCGEGFCEGQIGFTPHGTGGFGYDPLFYPNDTPGKTMAELTPDQKNEISHRRHAIDDLAQQLREIEE